MTGIGRTVEWCGRGRWLSFGLAAVLILTALPLVFHRATGAMAGWNIFLGLLLAGAVGSGYRHAPRIALIIAVLMLIRLAMAIVFMPVVIAIIVELLIAALAAVAAYDLRRQAQSG